MRILDHPYWAVARRTIFWSRLFRSPLKPVTVTYCAPGNAEGAVQSPIWQGIGRGTDPVKYLG